MLRLTLIVDDMAAGRGFIAEHGFSMWIEQDGRKYLFDTGQGQALVHNANQIGIDLNEAGAILVSHGHYDHTGGLATAVRLAPGLRVYAHPEAFRPKFARSAHGNSRSIGMPEPVMAFVRENARIQWVEAPVALSEGMSLTGPIPRVTSFEDTGGPFFSDEACATQDELIDDQAVYSETRYGLVVILGCGHAGVINTLHYVQKLTGGAPIHTVIGGMHLLSASSARIRDTIEALKSIRVRRLIPLHCTGFKAMAMFREAFPVEMTMCSIGTRLEYD